MSEPEWLVRSATADDAARIAGVTVIGLTQHGSKSRRRAFEIQLSGSAAHRSQYANRDSAAATWDEWGIFLGALFARDDRMTVPRVYDSADHFSWANGGQYDGGKLSRETHKVHRWNFDGHCVTARWRASGHYVTGSYSVSSCKCGAVRRRMRNRT